MSAQTTAFGITTTLGRNAKKNTIAGTIATYALPSTNCTLDLSAHTVTFTLDRHTVYKRGFALINDLTQACVRARKAELEQKLAEGSYKVEEEEAKATRW